MISKRTPSGIARPKSGQFSSHDVARTIAKGANMTRGRGYRAIKAQDGTHAVIFRPAVANNRQRTVRAVDYS